MQVVAHGGVGEPRRFGDGGSNPRQRCRHAEMGDIGGFQARFVEAPFDERQHDGQIAGVANPTLFPLIVVFGFWRAEVIDEVGGPGCGGEQPRHRFAVADQDCGRAVAGGHFDRARGLCMTLVGRHDQRFGRARQGARQSRGGRPLGGGDIEGGDVL